MLLIISEILPRAENLADDNSSESFRFGYRRFVDLSISELIDFYREFIGNILSRRPADS